MYDLKDKVAVITGGSSGIGKASAFQFASAGAKVIITGRNEEKLLEAAREIGMSVVPRVADVSRETDREAFYSYVAAEFGGIDVLFLNAGVASFAPVSAVSEGEFDRILGVNLKGSFFALQGALPIMGRGGSIIMTTSVAGTKGTPNSSLYAASKAALSAVVRSAAAELLPKGIRVNAVSPGPTNTGIFDTYGLSEEQKAGMKAGLAGRTPIGRLAESEEVARVALFLASDASALINGSELHADGGISNF